MIEGTLSNHRPGALGACPANQTVELDAAPGRHRTLVHHAVALQVNSVLGITAHTAGISRKTLALLRNRERAVIQVANRAAEAAGRQLTDYKRPKAMCYSSAKLSFWSVQY